MIPIRGLRAPVLRFTPVDPPHTSASRIGETRCNWTPEKDRELRRLWNAGVAARLIGESIGTGVSKGAVIGRARRLGLEPRATAAVRGVLWG